jgi:hypothetical protein
MRSVELVMRATQVACCAAVVSITTRAGADIDPPAGLDHLSAHELVLENPGDFSDWVFVMYPCAVLRGAPLSLDPYCILRETKPGEGARIAHLSTIHALRTSDVTVTYDPKGGVHGDGAWSLTRPKIEDETAFFERDRRVVRPGFTPDRQWGYYVPEGLAGWRTRQRRCAR